MNAQFDFSGSEIPTYSKPRVVVTDIQMPFWSMVIFMVKWAIAAIPAAIILFLLVAMPMGIIFALVVAWMVRFH